VTYVRALFIPEALRRAGIEVVERPGWRKRGRPKSVGGFDPRALMIHHDATAKGRSPEEAKFIAETGRPAEGIPAPLANCWVNVHGVWHVLASGRTNHAGKGQGFGRIPRNSGNTYAIGVETDHTTGEKWPKVQLDAIKLGFAALADAMHIDPEKSIASHKEYTTRKTDPHPLNMDRFRAEVAQLSDDLGDKRHRTPMRRMPSASATVDLSNVREAALTDPAAPQGNLTHKADVLPVERALRKEGLLADSFVDGSFGSKTIEAYKAWQRECGFRGADADGIPGVATLTKLGHRHDFRVHR
jgi:N-acetylmuramoyl-L-alanine amidase-like protein/putative peptidoglycan binding protein